MPASVGQLTESLSRQLQTACIWLPYAAPPRPEPPTKRCSIQAARSAYACICSIRKA